MVFGWDIGISLSASFLGMVKDTVEKPAGYRAAGNLGDRQSVVWFRPLASAQAAC
jgi:hypothetical protein